MSHSAPVAAFMRAVEAERERRGLLYDEMGARMSPKRSRQAVARTITEAAPGTRVETLCELARAVGGSVSLSLVVEARRG